MAPWQGFPHSLLCATMSRCLSQSPAAVGWLHSLQVSNLQSRGMHGGVHGVEAEQALRLSCAPWHLAPLSARKSASFDEVVRLNARLCIAVPWPQPTPHPVEADHAVQAQKRLASQWPLHFSISLALLRSHMRPQWFGIWLMERWRYLSPMQPEHSPHSDQSAQAQSWQLCCTQASELQGAVMVSSASQGLPPLEGRSRTFRLRSRWPPSQDLVHTDQSDQRLRRQSVGPASWQAPGVASAGPGLQGPVSFSDTMSQCFPLPLGKTLMKRLRSCTPKHVPEQKDHSLQSESWQSVSAEQGACSQALYSCRRPDAGLPHASGSRSMARRRTA
mmetsp:Transcript_97469/g.303590  ORF Transcript_97469/g.303590 Transcript_97469/m.303590 type:complete len:331 (-) Transcript_97469:1509-2501(-)